MVVVEVACKRRGVGQDAPGWTASYGGWSPGCA